MSKNTVNQKPVKLDAYERELEDNFEAAMPLSAAEEKKTIGVLKVAAKNHQRKGKRITIRVYENDLEKIKKIASEEGLPYQTFIASILHKLSTGNLRINSNYLQ